MFTELFMFIYCLKSRIYTHFKDIPMKKRFTPALLISLFSIGLFAQDFKDFTRLQKPVRQERPSAYHEMIDTYKAFTRYAMLKSTTDLGIYLDTAQIQLFIEEDQYLPVFMEILQYDASDHMIRSKTIVLSSQTYLWENSSRTEFTYDASGNIIQSIHEEWDENYSEWDPTRKTEYSFDANNNLVQIVEYDWNEGGNQFVNSRKVVISVDENGLETQTLVYLWAISTEEWEEAWKYEYLYDANESLLLETEYAWDDGLLDWVNSWKTQYTYNEMNDLTLKEEFNWNSETSVWDNYWKSSLSYDANGNVNQQLDSMYLSTEGPWQETWTAEYTYDEQNNPLTELYSQWDETMLQLVLTARYQYSYDNNTPLSELIVPPLFWFLPDYRQQIVSKPLGYVSEEYNQGTSGFEEYYREVYFYNEHFPTQVLESGTAHIASIFPNPAREYITVDFAGEYPEVFFELLM